jgi:putative peptidoglycan lipid II flippase
VTGPPASVTEPRPLRQVSRSAGSAAALIGGITIIARMVGFGRQLVFAHTVGSHCLGTAYATANQVPNIIYDIVLGGALTSAVVPVLASAARRRTSLQAAAPGVAAAGVAGHAAVTLLACLIAATAFGVAVLMLDGRDLRVVAGRTAGRWIR